MPMYDNRILLALRSMTRLTGLNKIVGLLIGLVGYEHAFGNRILSQIREGDCVWDVGANLGLYSDQFLSQTGTNGRVVAFEPSTECFKSLQDKLSTRPGFIAVNAALGKSDGQATLFCSVDPLAATHTLSSAVGQKQHHEGDTYSVIVYSADSFLAQNPSLTPNVIKIDVEGFEAAVLDGMTNLLSQKQLRSIFIEVHFTLLEAQGKKDAPIEIVKKLREAGFTVNWPDHSHIAAIRSVT
jgi:FkbM family methyltransferase